LLGDAFFLAHRELILFTVRSSIEEERFLPRLKGQTPRKRSRLGFWRRTFPLYTDLALIQAAGALTGWGRSLATAMVFFLVIVATLGFLYITVFRYSFKDAYLRALDVTLVAGYTAHTSRQDSGSLQLMTLCNLALGLYWYSLIVPVITRKFLR